MREIRLSGSEGGETGIQPVFPTPINLATISPQSRHGLATVSLRSRRGLAFVWHSFGIIERAGSFPRDVG
jgi:hypothetical protein